MESIWGRCGVGMPSTEMSESCCIYDVPMMNIHQETKNSIKD